MTLHAAFEVRRPEHTTAIELTAEPGDVIGLIGPNGAGKTTTLRALAGLLRVTSGSITIDGHVVSSTTTHLAAPARNVGYVFQEHLLFPHLTAAQNVAFGLRARGTSRREANAVASRWLERIGVAELADRKPAQLSGGQGQRVALARALATNPGLLLLDEPTAALDAQAAMNLRSQLRAHLDDFSGITILVTHTALDAMVMTDRLVVLDGGAIVQSGTPAEVAAHPRTHHVAALVGLNLIRGNSDGAAIRTEQGAELVAPGGALAAPGPVFATFTPTAVSIFNARPDGSPRNVWPGSVKSIAPHGDVVRVQIDAAIPLIADITPAAVATLGLQPGASVWAAVKATEITVYAA